MKKFQFRLERVLRYHKQRLKEAEMRMALALRERDAAVQVVRTYEQQIEQAGHTNEKVGGLINPAIRTNLTAHLEYLAANLATNKERLKLAEQRFRETDRVRTGINCEVERLSQFRDQQKHGHHEEVMRLQQIDLDEVVMRQWSLNGADDPLLSSGMSE